MTDKEMAWVPPPAMKYRGRRSAPKAITKAHWGKLVYQKAHNGQYSSVFLNPVCDARRIYLGPNRLYERWVKEGQVKPTPGQKCLKCLALSGETFRISKVTPVHQKRAGRWLEEWEVLEGPAKPMDREAVTEAAERLYSAMRWDKPKIVFMNDPLKALKATTITGAWYYQNYQPAELPMDESLSGEVTAALEDKIRSAISPSVRKSAWRTLRPIRVNQIARRAAITREVRRVYANQNSNGGWKTRGWSWLAGQDLWVSRHLDAGLLWDYSHKVLGVGGNLMKAVSDLTRLTGWWYPFTKAIAVMEKPTIVFRDDWGRLHASGGPALKYPRSGYKVYAINGVVVPEDVVMKPQNITPNQADREGNAEVRRIMIQRMGAHKYMTDRGGQMIHKDEHGELWEVRVPNDWRNPLMRMVRVWNATPEPDGSIREFWIQVPNNVTTAHEAVAWTFSMTPDQYDLLEAS